MQNLQSEDDSSARSYDEDTVSAGKAGSFMKNPGQEPPIRRRRVIDETKLDPESARKLESRRAYNRQCAAKARQRSKDLIKELTSQVEDLTTENTEVKRENEVLKAQLQILEKQNQTLVANASQRQMGGIGGFGGMGGMGGMDGSQFLAMQGGLNRNIGGFQSVSPFLGMGRQGLPPFVGLPAHLNQGAAEPNILGSQNTNDSTANSAIGRGIGNSEQHDMYGMGNRGMQTMLPNNLPSNELQSSRNQNEIQREVEARKRQRY